MNEVILSGLFVPFFPCSSMQQVEITEWFVFATLPDLNSFSREVTPVERAAGITEPHAIVLKTTAGVTRKYGTSTPLK
jgi:hypothetical protein